MAKLKMYTTQAENEKLCFRVLSEYLHILQDWKRRYAPQTPEELDDRFVEACHKEVVELADVLGYDIVW